jgi:D-3-phosphoglycerate dehydrogenase / 2-oxoglutarate reductase
MAYAPAMTSLLPVLFFDRDLPDEFRDLVSGRAIAVGPHDYELDAADGVIAGMRTWDAETMARAPRLRVISRTGVGYDTVDLAAATAAGITVCYAPQAPTVSTAEHTIALIMAVTKGLRASQDRAVHGHSGGPATALELDGRTLGLLGFGRIARRVATVGAALGMTVIAHDPLIDSVADDPTVMTPVTMVALDELWLRSDIISLHAPATVNTRHIVDASALQTMRRGSYLINCARGALVDHAALVNALDSGQLGGVGLDVTEPEPLPVGHPLLTHPLAVVTPHVASGTVAGRRRLYEHAINHALATLAGTPTSVVPEQTSR